MKKTDIQENIKQAIKDMTPDIYEIVANAPISQPQREKYTMENKVKNKFNAVKILTPILAVAVMAVFVGTQFTSTNGIYSTISLDVNPSIELEANKNDEVINVNTFNEDAVLILNDMDLENVDIDVAVNAIMGSMLQHGYITPENNIVMVSVESDDDAKAEELKQRISLDIEATLASSSIDGIVVSQTVDSSKLDETQNQLSAGKQALIYKLMSYDASLTYEMLAAMSLDDIDDLVDDMNLAIEDVLEDEIDALEDLEEDITDTDDDNDDDNDDDQDDDNDDDDDKYEAMSQEEYTTVISSIEQQLEDLEVRVNGLANLSGSEKAQTAEAQKQELDMIADLIDDIDDVDGSKKQLAEALKAKYDLVKEKHDKLEDEVDDYDDQDDDNDDDDDQDDKDNDDDDDNDDYDDQDDDDNDDEDND